MTDLKSITEQLALMQEQVKKVAEDFQPKMPEVKFNKNGYEIRTSVLEMAKQFTEFEYSMKFAGFEQTAKRDQETGEIVNTTTMPEVPGVEQVLDNAEKFYNFINKR